MPILPSKDISHFKMFIKPVESPLQLWEDIRQTIQVNDSPPRKWIVDDINRLRFGELSLYPVERLLDKLYRDQLIIAGIRDGGIDIHELAQPFGELVKLLLKSDQWRGLISIKEDAMAFQEVDFGRLKRELEQ